MRKISVILSNMTAFYDSQLVFAQDNNTFQSKYHQIMDGYNNASNYQVEMNSILTEVYDKVNASSTFTEGAWQDFSKIYVKYFNSYKSALQGLSYVYTDCIPGGVQHNDLTIKILETINNYLDVIYEEFNEGLDGLVSTQTSYVINYASTFITKYIVNSTSPISNYKTSETLKNKLSLVNKFEETFDKTITDVIKSITKDGITFETLDANKEEVLNVTKEFLQGGFSR